TIVLADGHHADARGPTCLTQLHYTIIASLRFEQQGQRRVARTSITSWPATTSAEWQSLVSVRPSTPTVSAPSSGLVVCLAGFVTRCPRLRSGQRALSGGGAGQAGRQEADQCAEPEAHDRACSGGRFGEAALPTEVRAARLVRREQHLGTVVAHRGT